MANLNPSAKVKDKSKNSSPIKSGLKKVRDHMSELKEIDKMKIQDFGLEQYPSPPTKLSFS